jgi:hypothetical protein
MSMTANYLFQLSPLELHWLADAFGVARLPLSDDPLRHVPDSRRKTEVQNGLTSLESRRLISRASSGYQVDQLPAGIIQWLGSATGMLILDVYTCNGISRHAQVFTQEDTSMSVSLEEGNYQFLFLPTGRAVSDYLLKQVGASFADPKAAAPKYALSQPVTILRAAWKDPSLAGRMLKVIGIKPKEAQSLLAWAASLEWILALDHIQIRGKDDQGGRKAVLCGTSQTSWLADMDGQPDEIAGFSPVNSQTAHTAIQHLL